LSQPARSTGRHGDAARVASGSPAERSTCSWCAARRNVISAKDGSFGSYGIESIQDFAFNVDHLLNGGALSDLKGKFADGNDGIEVTKIAVGVHKSLETGAPVKLSEL
jgi:hypothetical protein